MAAGKARPPVVLALGLAVAVVVVQALLVPLFAGPASRTGPREVPVVVAGPPPVAGQLVDRLQSARPGAFEVTIAPADVDAAEVVRDREAYGVFQLTGDGLRLYTASAASPAVAALLTQVAQGMAQAAPGGLTVEVVDVVPTSADDPQGAGFAAGFLPLVMTSLLAGIALLFAVPRRPARLTGLLAYAVLAGLAGAAVLQGWLGVLEGDYLLNAAVIGLVALAVAAGVAGLGAVLGAPGVALGAIVVFLVGNPLSGVAVGPHMLPQPWGAIGQFLPPGAGGTLLRSVAWFDGAGSTAAWLVLGAWAVAGLLLVAVGRAKLHRSGSAEV